LRIDGLLRIAELLGCGKGLVDYCGDDLHPRSRLKLI
jgi:hypothetical protein